MIKRLLQKLVDVVEKWQTRHHATILDAFEEGQPAYGLQLVERIQRKTGKDMYGVIYVYLERMERAGIVRSYLPSASDTPPGMLKRRMYYRTTNLFKGFPQDGAHC